MKAGDAVEVESGNHGTRLPRSVAVTKQHDLIK